MDRAEFLNRLEAQLLDVPQAEREEALQYYEDYLNDAGDAGDFDILQELGTPEEVADSIRNGLGQDSSGVGERSYGSQSSRSGQAGENRQDSSRSGQAGDSGYFSENGYVDREPQKEELQRVKQPAHGDRSDADWQSADSYADGDSSAVRRKQPPVWLWILLIVFAAPVVLPIAFGLLVAAISVLFALFITGIALLVCGIVCAGAGIWALIQAFTQIVAWPAAAMIGIGISLAAIGIGILMTMLMGWLIGKVVPTGIRALCNCLHRIVTRKGGRAA